MISYAQNHEDVLLARAFPNRKTGFYVDVGAMDPVEGSVTKHFYDLGWRGINIEPDARFFERLRQDRPRDINLNIALGAQPDTLDFHLFEEQGISTFNAEFAAYFIERGRPHRVMEYPVHTLADTCAEHVHQEIDFLKIDAEGWEGPILEGADWTRFRPLVVLMEATMPYSHLPAWRDSEPKLLAASYEFVHFDGLNRFYVREESRHLKEAFLYPPCVLDGYKPYSLAEAERQRCELQQRAQALEAQEAELRQRIGALEQEADRGREAAQRLTDELHGAQAELHGAQAETRLRTEEFASHQAHAREQARLAADAFTQQHAIWHERSEQQAEQLKAAAGRVRELERSLSQEQYARRAQTLDCLIGRPSGGREEQR